MDVSPSNIGMIAAYYNISCKSFVCFKHQYPYLWAHRRHRWHLHQVLEEDHKVEGSAWDRLLLCRIPNSANSSPWRCSAEARLWSRTRQIIGRFCQLRWSLLQNVHIVAGSLLSTSAATRFGVGSKSDTRQSSQSPVGLRGCDVFKRMVKCPWSHGLVPNVRSSHVGNGLSAQADPALWAGRKFMFAAICCPCTDIFL